LSGCHYEARLASSIVKEGVLRKKLKENHKIKEEVGVGVVVQVEEAGAGYKALRGYYL
jgi:hypothetical protein